jgi:hypothetical protein
MLIRHVWVICLAVALALPATAWGGIIVTQGKAEEDDDQDPCAVALADEDDDGGQPSPGTKLSAGAKASDEDPCGLTDLDTTPPGWSCFAILGGLQFCVPPQLEPEPTPREPGPREPGPREPGPREPGPREPGKADGETGTSMGASETSSEGSASGPAAGCQGASGGAGLGWLGGLAMLWAFTRRSRLGGNLAQ